MIDICSKNRKELEEFFKKKDGAAFRGRQLFKWIWQKGSSSFKEMTDLPRGLREELSHSCFIYSLKPIKKNVSQDGTIKWALGLLDGLVIETVAIPERDHFTLCISSQVGCAMGCLFCKTGTMGLKRNLEPSEIACQALFARKELSKDLPVRNIVFMGMGEPLANLENVLKAIEILTDHLGLSFSKRRITVSTSGIVPKIVELGKRTDVGLAISLHATTDRVRNRLMPINRRYPINELLSACKNYDLPKRRRITFEYLLIKGINDSPDDARRLSRLLAEIPSKINLIPFNPVDGFDYAPPDFEKITEFQQILKSKGYTTIIRKSKGKDIGAACGQLCYDMKI